MSDSSIEENLNNVSEIVEETEAQHDEIEKNEINQIKNAEIELTSGNASIAASKTQRSDKTKFERAKDAKQRAIDNFTRGVLDPEFRVVKMSNGKYRTYKRKDPLPPDPINVNQIPENKRSSEITNDESEVISKARESKQSGKQQATPASLHDPFSDIVYYNMTNQISEQLNKRLDAVNVELERLRHKNSKLKGKYKQLKQAIYITEEEESHEEKEIEQPIQQQQPGVAELREVQPIQQQQPIETPIIRPIRRTTGINYNRFFN